MADNDIQKMVDGWENRLRNANANTRELRGLLGQEQAENARLQARVELLDVELDEASARLANAAEAGLNRMRERNALQARVEGLEANRREAFSLIVSYSDEADEARALAERRKEALKKMTAYTEEWHPVTEDGCVVDEDIGEAHAAIKEKK